MSLNETLTIIIIGGGAAGFFAAITTKLANPNNNVMLLEAGKVPLSKVRISGGGRCNVTHHCFEPSQLIQAYPRGNKALKSAFTRFQPQDTIQWFESQGIKLKTETDGRIFPVTDNSESIVNCLMNSAEEAGVNLRLNCRVQSVEKVENQFILTLKSGEFLKCDRLLIATGSHPLGYHFAQILGHTIISPVPSLFTFTIKDKRLQNLAGISVDNVTLTLLSQDKNKLKQTGSLLITHWGISGPAVLKLSAWGAKILHDNHYQLPLRINWLPEYNYERLKQAFLSIKTQYPKRQIKGFFPVNLPKRLWQSFVGFLDINPDLTWSEISNKQINLLIQECIQGQYKIVGKGIFKEEFVTCGGVNLKEINFKTMESKVCSGLFFAGEILDIDGITGGFNFQNAWTTGWIAGQSLGD